MTLAMTSTWATCLAAAAAAASAREAFPSTRRFSPSFLDSQADLAEVASEVVVVSRGAVSPRVSQAAVAAEHVDFRADLEASKASTSVDKRTRMTRATAHQSTLLMMMMTSRRNGDREEKPLGTNRKKTVETARARHLGGVLRRRRLRLRVTNSYSSSARSAWPFWQPLSSSPHKP